MFTAILILSSFVQGTVWSTPERINHVSPERGDYQSPQIDRLHRAELVHYRHRTRWRRRFTLGIWR